jgi:hypothetical protein
MTTEDQRSKRARHVVEPRSQLRLSLAVAAYLGIFTLAMGAIVFAPTLWALLRGLPYDQLLLTARPAVWLDFGPVALAALLTVAAAVHFVTVTHRVFGPLVRMRKGLRRWRENRVWPPLLYVRRHDFHRTLFEEFNRTSGELALEVAEVREGLRSVADRLRLLPAAAADPNLTGELRRAEADCQRLLERLDRWEIGDANLARTAAAAAPARAGR